MVVHGAERVVHEVDVRAGVHRARDGDALLLPTGQRHPALADVREVFVREHVEVLLELARRDGLLVLFLVVGLTEEDVLADGAVEDPRLLRDVRDGPGDFHLALHARDEVVQPGQERGLPGPDAADDHRQRPGFKATSGWS